VRALLERVVVTAGRRPGRVLLAVALVAGVSTALALRLEPSTAVETLVGKRSDSYRATEVYRQKFGDHAIVVLAKGDLANLVLTDNLGRLLGLEGCISGNKPKDQAAPGTLLYRKDVWTRRPFPESRGATDAELTEALAPTRLRRLDGEDARFYIALIHAGNAGRRKVR